MPKEVGNEVKTTEQLAADRRSHPRYKLNATVEVVDDESGKRIKADLGDLSKQGLYVATSNPFPLGTIVKAHIAKGTELCDAEARVVFSRSKAGMGLFFTAIEPASSGILATWITGARENAWLALTRRRSQRVLLRVPLTIFGKNTMGVAFEEDAETTTVSAHGALLLLSMVLSKGQAVSMSNKQTKAAAECIVVHLGEVQGDRIQVGVEFALPSPTFWHVAFPPKDWSVRHPDAKVR